MTLVQSSYNALLARDTRAKKPHLLAAQKRRIPAVTLRGNSRIGGLGVISPSGGGKSIMFGKHLALADARQQLPQVILDVGGQAIQNFLHALLFLSPDEQQEILNRVVYANMAGQDGFVPSFPMLEPFHRDEPLSVTAARLPELLGQLDENFATASIQGLSRTIPIASSVGKILRALDLPIAHVHDLLRAPELWLDRIQEAAARDPEARLAAEDLYDLMAVEKRAREERVNPFINRLYLLRDNINRAILSSTRAPTIDYERAAFYGETILVDLSFERNQFARQWKLMSVFNQLMEYIETRGRNVTPMGLIIDELTFFTRGASLNLNAIEEKLLELFEVRMRNNAVFVTVGTQSVNQLSEDLMTAVLNLKSHLFGTITDSQTSVDLAQRYYEMDPWAIKTYTPVWVAESVGPVTNHFVIDYLPVFLTLDEQTYLNSRNFATLQKGEWLFAESTMEGQHASTVRKIYTPHLYKPPFASENEHLLSQLRSYLSARDGEPIDEILAEIEAQRLYELPAVAKRAQVAGREAAPPDEFSTTAAERKAGEKLPAPPPKPTGRIRTL